VGDLAAGRGARRADHRLRRDERAEPARGIAPDLWKQLSILGSTMGTGEDFAGAYELVASGRALPVVDSVLPLEEIRAAHERLEAGEQLGKIVLTI
jgi:D-arabinose 1-dehydrogenase-like Zn-dependent alcohol dehydrogenase